MDGNAYDSLQHNNYVKSNWHSYSSVKISKRDKRLGQNICPSRQTVYSGNIHDTLSNKNKIKYNKCIVKWISNATGIKRCEQNETIII